MSRLVLLAEMVANALWHAVSRIALVKPEKARAVENMLIAAAQRGQLGEKVNRP